MRYKVTLELNDGKIEDHKTDDPLTATLMAMIDNEVIKSFRIRLA